MELGNNIRDRRTELGTTLEALAAKSHVAAPCCPISSVTLKAPLSGLSRR